MELGLKGKRALVIGGSAGIGFAIAEELGRAGAETVLASRSETKLNEAARLLAKKGVERVGTQIIDLYREDSIRNAIGALLKEGPLDIVINNTGGPAAGKLLKLPLKAWDDGYQTLLRSVLLISQLVIPEMTKRGWGRLLTVTSTSAVEIIPELPISSTFRAGLRAFAKTLAKEVGRQGILVNNLLPGPTRTARLQELETKSPDFFKSMSERSALGRIAEPEEIARVAAFLCSSANSYLTGTDILVDGGATYSV